MGDASARSAAPRAACLLAGPVVNAACVLLRALWSTAPASAALKASFTTARPRMTRITVLTGRAPVRPPTPVPAGAPWAYWPSAYPASAATPRPGCASPCASVPMTAPHALDAGAVIPTLFVARSQPPIPTQGTRRSAASPWRSHYDRPKMGANQICISFSRRQSYAVAIQPCHDSRRHGNNSIVTYLPKYLHTNQTTDQPTN